MALNFPDSPSIGDTYKDTTSGFAYEWDGTIWKSLYNAGSNADISVDTTPQLGGDLDLNSKNITGTGNINITGIVTTTELHVGVDTGFFTEDLVVNGDARITGILSIGTATIILDPTANKIQIGTGITLDANTNTIEVGSSKIADTSGNAEYSGILTAASFSGAGVTVTGTTFSNQLSVSGVSTFSDIDVRSFNAKFGTSTGSQIELNGNGGSLNKQNGSLKLYGGGTANSEVGIINNLNIYLKPKNGGVDLYYGKTDKKFETTNDGAIVTGILTATSFSGDGSNLTGLTEFDNLTVTGVSTFQSDVNVDNGTLYVDSVNNRIGIGTTAPSTAGVYVADIRNPILIGNSPGNQLHVGAGEIRTSGLHLNLYGGGTGGSEVNIRNNSNIRLKPHVGGVDLYYGKTAKKFETTNDGAIVTGILTATSFDGGTATFSSDVGIGTVSPSRKLHVASSFIRVDDGYGLDSSGSTEKVVLDNGFISLTTNSLEQIRIVSSGKVGIGTTNPNSTLNVVADSSANGLTIQNRTADDYGYLRFQNNAGTEAQAYIGCQRAGTSAGDLLFETAGSERLRIDSSGDVQIGTNAPFGGSVANRGHLTLNGTNDFKVQWGVSGTERGYLYADATNLSIINTQNGYLRFNTNNTERMRIDSSGSVIIKDSTGADNITLRHDGTNGSIVNNGGEFLLYAEGSQNMIFHTNSTERVRINSSGNLGLGSVSPEDPLHIKSNSGAIRLENTVVSNNDSTIAYDDTDLAFHVDPNNVRGSSNITFSGDGNERLRIDSVGRLLLGTDTYRSVGDPFTPGTTLFVENNGVSEYQILVGVHNRASGEGPTIVLGKSRGTAVGDNTIVQDNDDLGTIRFAGADGNDISSVGAEIVARVDGTPGANDMPGRISFKTTADGADSPTERMRITSDGVIKTSNTNTYVGATGDYNEINYSGNSASLILAARSSSTPFGYFYQSTDADPNNTSNYVFRALQNTGVNIYSIWSNGTVSARSDARYKKNIETTRDGYLEDLSQLRVVKYNWHNHEDDAPKELGLVAQEVEQVFPGLVLNEPAQDAEGNDTGEVCKSIKFSVFTPMLVKALQEAHARIEQLETRLAALENG